MTINNNRTVTSVKILNKTLFGTNVVLVSEVHNVFGYVIDKKIHSTLLVGAYTRGQIEKGAEYSLESKNITPDLIHVI